MLWMEGWCSPPPTHTHIERRQDLGEDNEIMEGGPPVLVSGP